MRDAVILLFSTSKDESGRHEEGAPVDSRTIRSVWILYSRLGSEFSDGSTWARRAVTAARASSKRDI